MTESLSRMPRSSAGRLIGEFVVIVVGVLVALAMDAAWEVRAERLEEDAYHASLAQDLRSDTAEYRIALGITARSIEAARDVRSAILGRPTSAARPLSQSLIYASWVNYPSWSFGTLDELYGAGTIRLVRDADIKDGLHAYRSYVNEWRPRMGPPEKATFLAFRQEADGLVPLEARIGYWRPSLEDERVPNVDVDEVALAKRLRGDDALLELTEHMILEWVGLQHRYEEQLALALALLGQVELRAGQ